MLVHEISPPYQRLVEYMSADSFSMILTSLICSLPPSPTHHLSRPINYYVTCDLSLDLGHIDHLLDMLEGNTFDVSWSLGTLRGYNASLDPFHAYLVDLDGKIM